MSALPALPTRALPATRRAHLPAAIARLCLGGLPALALACAMLFAAGPTRAEAPDGEGLFRAKGCVVCHGEGGHTPATPVTPKLAGQSEGYLVRQMRAFSVVHRRGSSAEVMWHFATPLTDAEIHAIAAYLAGVPRTPPGGATEP